MPRRPSYTEVWRVILFWSKQNTDRCSLTPEMRRLMIFREQRQQTGGDNRSHALVTEVSCVTRPSWQSRDNSGSNLVSIIGSFLGVKGQHYYCLIVKIKSQENTNSQTAQDNGQTSVNINRQTLDSLTQVWLCDWGGMSDCWSVEVTVTSWHPCHGHQDVMRTLVTQLIRDQVSCPSVSASAAPGHLGTGASVLPARAFSLIRHLTQTWYWVRDLDWMSLDNVCIVYGPRYLASALPSRWRCEYFVCILGFLSCIDRDLGPLSEESVTITRTIYNNYGLSNCCESGQ